MNSPGALDSSKLDTESHCFFGIINWSNNENDWNTTTTMVQSEPSDGEHRRLSSRTGRPTFPGRGNPAKGRPGGIRCKTCCAQNHQASKIPRTQVYPNPNRSHSPP